MDNSCTTSFNSPVPEMVVSCIPFMSTARRLRRAISYSPISSTSGFAPSASESNSTTTSGSNTPLIRPKTPSELSMTQLDVALSLSNTNDLRSGGIDWNSAILGHQMLISAAQRAQSEDDLMARLMYIDALKYLHGGLPTDLSESERQTLYAFNPALLESSSNRARETQSTSQDTMPGSKLLRSSTASVVAFLITIVMLAMPLLTAIANRLLEYERKYHITERLARTTGQIMKAASAKSITIGGHLISLSQRQISAYAIISLLGLVHSVVDGVSDGVERSLNARSVIEISDNDSNLSHS